MKQPREAKLDQPVGPIAACLGNHGRLANAYYQFLMEVDPLENWEQVRPLSVPIVIEKEYPIDRQTVERLKAVCPPLVRVVSAIQDQNIIAPRLGLRYAWSRLNHHAFVLDVVEELVAARGKTPSVFIEPGCLNGGLLHFLARTWQNVPVVGFDVSPIALDVCAHFADRFALKKRPLLVEANFAQIDPRQIPHYEGGCENGLLLLSNFIETVGGDAERFAGVDPWYVKSRLVSHWVNHGVAVLLAERYEHPDTLLETILENGDWEQGDCLAQVFTEFDGFSTMNMSIDNPLGDWKACHSAVLGFFPPGWLGTKRDN